jgi:osmotically inducible lipoprotein OsmB
MKVAKYLFIATLAIGLTACDTMNRAQKNAAIGAAAGGALGYVVTGGPLGTLGGAAIGGAVGAKR